MHREIKQFLTFFVLALAIIAAGAGLRLFLSKFPSWRLTNFTALVKTDPLFYSPFIDSADWQSGIKAVSALNEEINAYFASYEKKHPGAVPYASPDYREYPDLLLTAIGAAVKLTDTFLAAPNSITAHNLIAAYERAGRAYDEAADEFLRRLDLLVKSAGGDAAAIPAQPLINSATSVAIARADAELIKKNAEALLTEIAARKRCLDEGFCPQPRAFAPIPSPVITAAERVKILPLELLFPLFKPSELGDVKGPYAAPSGCWGLENGKIPQRLFMAYQFGEGSDAIFWVKLATENYYRDLAQTAGDPSLEAVAKSGARYLMLEDTKFNRCPDLTYWPEAATQYYLDQIRASIAPKDAWKIDIARRARLIGFPEILRALPEPTRDIINYDGFLDVFEPTVWAQLASYYSLFFFPFSDSIWRLDKKPVFLVTDAAQLSQIMARTPSFVAKNRIPYSQLKNQYSYEQILDWSRKSREAYIRYFRHATPFF